MNNYAYLEGADTLRPLAKDGTKFTMICLGGGMLGGDVTSNVTSRGWITTAGGRTLAWSEPRGRKKFCLFHTIRKGAILLRGHRKGERPIFDSDIVTDGWASTILDGKGGRFVDAEGDYGAALIAYLKGHLICHTLLGSQQIMLLEREKKDGGRKVVDQYFGLELRAALGPPLEFDRPPLEFDRPEDAAPARKKLLTDVMKANLMEACGKEPPKVLYKIFDPTGSATWLLCSLEADGDTLWAVCDLGVGLVEYGTVSLRELETAVGSTFKLHMERYIHFDPRGLSVATLCGQTNLNTLSRAS